MEFYEVMIVSFQAVQGCYLTISTGLFVQDLVVFRLRDGDQCLQLTEEKAMEACWRSIVIRETKSFYTVRSSWGFF